MSRATQSFSSDPGRARVARRAFAVFVALVLATAIAVVVRGVLDDRDSRFAVLVAAILGGASVLLGWLASRAHRTMLPAVPRVAFVLALAYHASFGPALMLTRAIDPVSRNDDLVMRLWPHVIHAINSFE